MKRYIALSAFTALTSAVAIHGIAQACDGHEQGPGAHLQAMDKDGDGKVTQAEMLQAWTTRFDAADTNHDGAVSAEEHTAARSAHMKERLAKLDAHHATMGKDRGRHHDGKKPSTKAELSAEVAEHFKRMDSNGDGALSGDELTRGPRGEHGGHGGEHGSHHFGPKSVR